MAQVKSVEDLVHDDHTEHSTRFYWIVGAILAVVTAIEVGITGIKIGETNFAIMHLPHPILIGVLLVLSAFKGAAVVMFFMHLKGDRLPYQLVFLLPFSLAVIFILAMLLLFSTHVGIAG